jgi:hypothetical protein
VRGALGVPARGAPPLTELYGHRLVVPDDAVPQASHPQHTMGSSINTYVAQRVPGALLDEALAQHRPIEVHGIYPDHMAHVRPRSRLVHAGHAFAPTKTYNVVRPRFFVDGSGPGQGSPLLVAVPPGRDYVLHNASLIRHYVTTRGHPADAVRAVVRYPAAESGIAAWSGLADFVEPGDRVLMGYVGELLPLLLRGPARVVERRHNDCYGAVRLRLPDGGRLCLLGVRFSFWGCISARLAATCQALGVDEIVYAGKLGTLTAPADIYDRLFLPSAYLDYRVDRRTGGRDGERLLARTAAPPNRLLEHAGELDSGVHMSVGTVLEEDVAQRMLADSYAVRSIDNEIAQMAWALAGGSGARWTAFSALHFATDYLRRPGEQEPCGVYNLTNHRRRDALHHKHHMISKVAEVLRAHYCC